MRVTSVRTRVDGMLSFSSRRRIMSAVFSFSGERYVDCMISITSTRVRRRSEGDASTRSWPRSSLHMSRASLMLRVPGTNNPVRHRPPPAPRKPPQKPCTRRAGRQEFGCDIVVQVQNFVAFRRGDRIGRGHVSISIFQWRRLFALLSS